MPDYKEEIKKTGFILENRIVKILKEHSWSIISNKYYEDDIAETVREIDILAYKVSKIDEIQIYTALIISCKKSEENAWALVCRDINLNEPNSNWWPLHIWTNDTALKQLGFKVNFEQEYYSYMHEEKDITVMEPPLVDIFAYQEMNKKNGRAQNDKSIFSSITTLMKAQAYEIDALSSRKGTKSLYQFNLISIIDSDLIKLHINDLEEITEHKIESEQMVARYIIRKKEQFFRIRFILSNAFDKYIDSFNSLHKSNIEFFKKKREEWIIDSIKNYPKLRLLQNEFINEIKEYISAESQWEIGTKEILDNSFLMWEHSLEKLKIFVTENTSITEKLNSSDVINERTLFFLKKIFSYNGEFYFSNDSMSF